MTTSKAAQALAARAHRPAPQTPSLPSALGAFSETFAPPAQAIRPVVDGGPGEQWPLASVPLPTIDSPHRFFTAENFTPSAEVDPRAEVRPPVLDAANMPPAITLAAAPIVSPGSPAETEMPAPLPDRPRLADRALRDRSPEPSRIPVPAAPAAARHQDRIVTEPQPAVVAPPETAPGSRPLGQPEAATPPPASSAPVERAPLPPRPPVTIGEIHVHTHEPAATPDPLALLAPYARGLTARREDQP